MNKLIDQAACFAAVRHDGQYRKGTHIPYITHPFGVAMILMEANQPEAIVAAGLLHDTLEDTQTTEEELFRHFGEEILMLVKAASESDKSLSWEIRKQRTIERLHMHSTSELNLILADKLHNLRTIHNDFRKYGNSVWSRFNRGKREQCWYYMSIIQTVKGKKREVPLIRKLEEETNELFIGKKRLTVHDIRLLLKHIHTDSEEWEEELRDSRLLAFKNEVMEAAGQKEQTGSEEESFRELLNREDRESRFSYLQELKFRLGWGEDAFMEYYRMYR